MKPTVGWIDAHARFRPQAVAVHDLAQDRRWTYAQLQRDARRWAGSLAARGVGPGDVIALLAHNRGETLTLLFAAAELGAVLFPMNWRLAPAELSWQLEDAGAAVLITDSAHAETLDRPRLSLDDGPDAPPRVGPGAADPERPAVLMYTSGTSGRPKGALLPHRQLYHNAVATVLACDLGPEDSTLTFTPLFHTGGLNCLSTPLLFRGGRVVISRGFEPGAALRTISEQRIRLLMGVPTIYQMLAEHADFERSDLSSVRDALCGGAPLSAPLLDRYLERGIPLRQGFGMTEVGPNCFSTPPDRVREKLGTVGMPIHHLEARLQHPDGRECAPGEPGELLLRGELVFSGYLGLPEATAAAFTDGWFHTGDILSRDAEGFYTVRGRKKEMFISGGENVYPAEVEAALLCAPGVGQCAVLGVPHARWGEVGHAFVEPAPGARLEPARLRAALQDRLARFKIPKTIELRAQLPRTASGKVDKAALSQELHS